MHPRADVWMLTQKNKDKRYHVKKDLASLKNVKMDYSPHDKEKASRVKKTEPITKTRKNGKHEIFFISFRVFALSCFRDVGLFLTSNIIL
jgi:hypothetical protein